MQGMSSNLQKFFHQVVLMSLWLHDCVVIAQQPFEHVGGLLAKSYKGYNVLCLCCLSVHSEIVSTLVTR